MDARIRESLAKGSFLKIQNCFFPEWHVLGKKVMEVVTFESVEDPCSIAQPTERKQIK